MLASPTSQLTSSTSRLAVQTILFPTDDSEAAEAARPLARALAERHGATLHVLHVEILPPTGELWSGPTPLPDPTTGHVVEVLRRSTTAAAGIALYADEAEVDLIVMGSHGRSGWNRFALGSTAEAVLRRADRPVLTVGPEGKAAIEGPVLVPLAFEPASDVALETAVAVAGDLGTRVVALHVIEPLDPGTLDARVGDTMREMVSAYTDGPVPVAIDVRHGDAAQQILDAAEDLGAGLVVQASHGRGGPARWVLGSVAEEVVRKAPCPVLTLHIGARQRLVMRLAAEPVPV